MSNPSAPAGPTAGAPNAGQGCVGQSSSGTLILVPEFATAFTHTTEPCDALATGALLKNSGESEIELLTLDVSSGNFRVSITDIPTAIQAGESVAVAISYHGSSEDGEEAFLVAQTSVGCDEFAIYGVATAGGLLTVSSAAIDFGSLAPTDSAVRPVQLVYQRNPDYPQAEIFGFSATPSELFELVDAPKGAVRPASCETFGFNLRVRAPADAGPIEGALTFFVQTRLAEGTAEGTVQIPLFGSVAP